MIVDRLLAAQLSFCSIWPESSNVARSVIMLHWSTGQYGASMTSAAKQYHQRAQHVLEDGPVLPNLCDQMIDAELRGAHHVGDRGPHTPRARQVWDAARQVGIRARPRDVADDSDDLRRGCRIRE